jgi:cobalamin biosynthesis Mg chelatase CobN
MIETLNTYAGLINIALFGTIIGFLIHIARMSRTAIVDKYEAQSEALRQRINILEAQENSTTCNHEAAIKLLERQLAFYKSVSQMPEDKRIVAIKEEYEEKLSELEAELATRSDGSEIASAEVARLEDAAAEVSNDPTPTSTSAMRVLEQVVKLTLKMYGIR